MHSDRTPDEAAPARATPNARFAGLDKLRGLLIANMALGHAVALTLGSRSSELWFAPSPSLTDPAAFALRMINHSATPFFFLVMGLSMALLHRARRRQGWSEGQVLGFFMARGLLLIALQFSVVNLGWAIAEGGLSLADLTWAQMRSAITALPYFGVLWALGLSMITAGMCMRLPSAAIALIAGCVFIAPALYLPQSHDPAITEEIPAALAALAVPGRWPDAYILYTPIPWLAMTLAGLLLGRLFLSARARFTALLVPGGLSALILFGLGIGARALLQGDRALLDILYLQRYPPEALLLLYATGVNFLLLALLQRFDLGLLDTILTTFGRSALMLYVTHLFVFAGVITVAAPDPTLSQAASLAALCLAILFPLCHLYIHHIKPMRQRLWLGIWNIKNS